jgi:hypothetical protein
MLASHSTYALEERGMAIESESNPKPARNLVQEMTELAGRASENFQDAYGSLDEIERLCIFTGLSTLDGDQQWALGEYGVVKTIAILQTAVGNSFVT